MMKQKNKKIKEKNKKQNKRRIQDCGNGSFPLVDISEIRNPIV